MIMLHIVKHKAESRHIKYFLVIFFAFAVMAISTQLQGRETTDIFGKKVLVPDNPRKVYGATIPATYMLYAVDPLMLAGLNVPIRERENKYIQKRMQELPVLGGWFGQGGLPNLEMILKVNPEIIVISVHNPLMNDKIKRAFKTMPIPVLKIDIDSLSDYPEAFVSLGRVLNRDARAQALAGYAHTTLSEMITLSESIPAEKKVSVYYAEGLDGLSTECNLSEHAELINLAGGRNVHECRSRDAYGMEKISFEKLMLYDPDVILVMENLFYDKVFSDPLWRRLRAVRNKKVYLIPGQPFNWFDRPPSFMRLLGVKWLANLLYPKHYSINMVKETKMFFKLFLGVELKQQEARNILQQP
ncbi:MAG TPA: ABC transporter substrate-binding protein [Syntrophorhabdaceae bacterium]|nr:hypothetical protein [Syntrophorhabdaceae bacterium]HNQ63139.1 ABC transporter substrate-binding protein [Syntrophorhabdaceae bacterium]HOB69053.1 ABC transporter substrate-binding protein [Syntrophorhabdaceae bacterium]HQM76660.1 ABC transporter substrate-binding protein [Syntrophorhabdaceae bacterium]